MSELLITNLMKVEQDQRVSEALDRDESRLRNWIARHVADPSEVEDVLQDVFFELVLAYRLTKPIEHVSAWLFRVARNRITDLLRKKRPEPVTDQTRITEEGDVLTLEDLLPSPGAGPEAEYARAVLLEELDEPWTSCRPNSGSE